ncbi:MAG: GntR family transcriptional regulator [Spirochaetia bacterium]|nr:GntR family transcriptional regulator [Spirochaetia bacterium]
MPVSSQNKFLKISASFIAEIRKGKIKGRFPSENEIARKFGISKATASRVLHHLREEGFIETLVGSGSTVRERRRTFVVRIGSDHERMKAACGPISRILSAKFPDVDFVFDTEGVEAKPDLRTITSHPPEGYASFIPYSKALVKKLSRLPLHNAASGIHQISGSFYARPFLASPTFLLANKKYFSAGGLAPQGARERSAIFLERLAQSRLPEGRSLYDLRLVHFKDLALFVLDGMDASKPGEKIPYTVENVEAGLRRWIRIRAASKPAADIRNGEALVTMISLMAESDYFLDTERFEPVWFPLRVQQVPVNFLHSQSLAISAHCRQSELAEEVIAHFFSEEVQNVFGEQGYGVPLRKGVKSKHPAAKLGLAELPHARWDYVFPQPPLLSIMSRLVRIHTTGFLSGDNLLDLVRSLMEVEAAGETLEFQ